MISHTQARRRSAALLHAGQEDGAGLLVRGLVVATWDDGVAWNGAEGPAFGVSYVEVRKGNWGMREEGD